MGRAACALALALALHAATADEHPSCSGWANMGECDKNPGYMLVSCKKSCQAVYNEAAAVDAMKVPESFDQLSARDIDGRTVHFGSEFRDRVVLITNVASE